MHAYIPRKTLAAAVVYIILQPLQAQAYPVEVITSVPIDTSVVPALAGINGELGTANSTLYQVGTAINQNGGKIAAEVEQAAQAQRDQDIFARQSERLEAARQSYTVPDSICSESASGAASSISSAARATQGALGGGSGISDAQIKQAVTDPSLASDTAQYRAAAIHAGYCDATDMATYAGTAVCKGLSTMPGADIQLATLIDGAGKPGKAPDLTFNQQQTDAAVAYALNSSARAAGRQLGKGEVKSATGQQYTGLMTRYNAINDAGREPMLSMIAQSQPQEATRAALKEALNTPSAKAYYDETASPQARKTGLMSAREFEQFEVGRRYANTAYLTDLQAMSGDNLTREFVRVQSLQNWLLLGIKQQLQKTALLQGQQLSLSATEAYRPQLQAKLREVSAGVTRNE
ncbi:conjugal transfer protein TraW [Dryocola clanedunensis]|uniref:conjugal transfer protein TraW n=1 Tax=Cedecea sulfonylureivorans TaxID=3051154 RepID=UPI00192561C0|nr:conjugal transfer protein TraW [Cedecea sulfonylureivorans]